MCPHGVKVCVREEERREKKGGSETVGVGRGWEKRERVEGAYKLVVSKGRKKKRIEVKK